MPRAGKEALVQEQVHGERLLGPAHLHLHLGSEQWLAQLSLPGIVSPAAASHWGLPCLALPSNPRPRGMCVCRVAFNSSISRTHAILFRTKARQQLANKRVQEH